MAISNEQLWAAFDALQNRQDQLEARVDALCEQMNKFVLEIRNNLAVLLDAKITDTKESSNGN